MSMRNRTRPRPDFSKRTHFPGTHGNRFDLVLHIGEAIESLPRPVFALLLLALAALPGLARQSWLVAGVTGLFLLGDWVLLAGLPRMGKSFGPANPPTLLLAFPRLLLALLPLPLNMALQLVGTALVIYGFWLEPQRLALTRETLRSAKLKAGRPLRVLHLGDLHAEIGLTGRERRLVELVREAQADVILFSGDFLNLSYLHDQRAWNVARSILRELHAPLGVYVVTGSPAVDLPEVIPALLAGLPNLRWLKDEMIFLEHEGQRVAVVGLTCTHKPFVDGPRLETVVGENPRDTFTILVYHTPDLVPEAAEAGIDLQLSGHTHGGQVRLPLFGAIYAASLYGKRYEVGRRQEGDLTLYVTRGIGMEGKGAPRVRCLCPPEITLWELSGSTPG